MKLSESVDGRVAEWRTMSSHPISSGELKNKKGRVPSSEGILVCANKSKLAKGVLTLKTPNKNCSRQHCNFLLLSFQGQLWQLFEVSQILEFLR